MSCRKNVCSIPGALVGSLIKKMRSLLKSSWFRFPTPAQMTARLWIEKLALTSNISGSTFSNPLDHTSFSSLRHHLGIFLSDSGCCINFGYRYGNNLLHLHRSAHMLFFKLSWTARLLHTAATLRMFEEVHGFGGYDDDIVRANFRWNRSLFCP